MLLLKTMIYRSIGPNSYVGGYLDITKEYGARTDIHIITY